MDSPDQLMAAAREETGLDDFGDDSFRDGLERLCRALSTEAKLNDIGGFAMPQPIGKLLTNRLQIEDRYRLHPEIDDPHIGAPVIGLAPPRTWCSSLSHLLE